MKQEHLPTSAAGWILPVGVGQTSDGSAPGEAGPAPVRHLAALRVHGRATFYLGVQHHWWLRANYF